ncbi:hypothetical protein SAMN05660841_01208 [Sphingobacterium nematocida]|uniref:Uncharacterized protein n=1 Tax=Sphingobacterium nematocida TaxID=1513896 RepID=A0A1T5C8L5_9SPHI|nr:hypothetical protein SAMN05660841_01208 [Sphingobacterium nematocida]
MVVLVVKRTFCIEKEVTFIRFFHDHEQLEFWTVLLTTGTLAFAITMIFLFVFWAVFSLAAAMFSSVLFVVTTRMGSGRRLTLLTSKNNFSQR